MSQDRFVRWAGVWPSRAAIGLVLEDYLGGAAKSVTWRGDRWIAVIEGTTSDPLRRVMTIGGYPEELQGTQRWIEVCPGDGCIDVLTRMQDELTNRIADGFAALCARHWDGKVDP